MSSAEIRSALANLRKCAKLMAKIESLQDQLENLVSDQYQFGEADFEAAMREFNSEQGPIDDGPSSP